MEFEEKVRMKKEEEEKVWVITAPGKRPDLAFLFQENLGERNKGKRTGQERDNVCV